MKTDGASLVVTFPGLSMGIFAGDLQFTVYKGTNLVRMDAAAKTSEPWVAYKYDAGLKGFSTDLTPRVTWRDTGGHPQQHQFGGVVNTTLARVRAQNRLIVAEANGGALAAFPPPHTFFFTREKDTNLGYVWYRKDAEGKFGIGVGFPEREEEPRYVQNFALYNAPPGTVQKMGVYFYASPDAGEPARQAVLAFTHGDAFKPLPGYKTFVNHFHLDFTGRQRASGSLDTPFQDLVAMRSLGLNVIGLSDFHFELHGNDPGPLRLPEQKDYFEASRRASDKDFLVVPWEEPSAYFGGHYNILWPKDVYWTKVRQPGQPFTEKWSGYGKVYHTGNAEDVQKMMDAEGALLVSRAPAHEEHHRLPGLILDKPFVQERSVSSASRSSPAWGRKLGSPDVRLALLRRDRHDEQHDTRARDLARSTSSPTSTPISKGPEDDLYANFPVNYLKIDKTPGPDDDYSPILKSLRDGNFFVDHGRDPDPELQRRGHGQPADHYRRCRLDLSAELRRGRVGRRQESRSPGDLRHRLGAVRHQALCDSVRRHRQIVGAICRLGLGRQRCVRPTGLGGGEGRSDDGVEVTCPEKGSEKERRAMTVGTTEIVPLRGGAERLVRARVDPIGSSGDGGQRHRAARRRGDLRPVAVQGELGADGGHRSGRR